MQSGMNGDAHHPGIGALPCRDEAGVCQQRLGQEMTAGASSPGPDVMSQRRRYVSFPGHQGNTEQLFILLQQVDIEIRALQQVPQITRTGLIMGQNEQAEHPIE